MIRRKYAPEDVSIDGDGTCLNCGNSISKDKRWCDKECAVDWEYMSRRSGK
jgi:predicted nucleic acid-binding Zn ribbon protein